MKLAIICVGKIKEGFYREAVLEYKKRLGRYAAIEIIELKDEKTKEEPSDNERNIILKKEAMRILPVMGKYGYCIALAIEGRCFDSEGFAGHMQELMNKGNSSIAFVIGGSLGLSGEVLKRADELIGFSTLTFPHQLMRVILSEQIYRAFRIINNEPYHK